MAPSVACRGGARNYRQGGHKTIVEIFGRSRFERKRRAVEQLKNKY
jgi:hypothetical protein